jgi:hypothetical protein
MAIMPARKQMDKFMGPGNQEEPITEVERPDSNSSFAALRQFARKRKPVERCELCSQELAHQHPHLIELVARRMVCACNACALLFDGRTGAKYKRVSRRVLSLNGFHLSDGQWEGLMIPINMAFFFNSSTENRIVVLYPSPAGAVESLLPLEAWEEIVRDNPALGDMEADVEALLLNRVGRSRTDVPAEYYLVPIDECYKLVGLIRAHWRGLSGGTEVWQEIGRFFADLKTRAVNVSEETHA